VNICAHASAETSADAVANISQFPRRLCAPWEDTKVKVEQFEFNLEHISETQDAGAWYCFLFMRATTVQVASWRPSTQKYDRKN
jgi:hypothetical protein